MKVYLAARFSRRQDMELVADQLRSVGVEVTSRWHKMGVHQWDDDDGPMPKKVQDRFAGEDLDDVAEADVLVLFTEEPGTYSRGGRHVEFGFAYGIGKDVVIVGKPENIFQNLNDVVQFRTVGGLIEYLRIEMNDEEDE